MNKEYTHPADQVADGEDAQEVINQKKSQEYQEAVEELKEVGIWDELEKSGIIGGTKLA